jgi:hypothetical protein
VYASAWIATLTVLLQGAFGGEAETLPFANSCGCQRASPAIAVSLSMSVQAHAAMATLVLETVFEVALAGVRRALTIQPMVWAEARSPPPRLLAFRART